jgi:hypothetical protein
MSNSVSPFHKVRAIFARNSAGAHKRRRTIQQFVDTVGIIYFGAVDQYSDEHRIIRGFTVSSSHRDDDFSVGTFEDYDISLVNRQDMMIDDKKSLKTHDWLLLEIQLLNQTNLPHIFIESKSDLENPIMASLNTTTLKKISLGVLEEYPIEFSTRYSIYASPDHAIESQQLISASVARSIGAHFWPLSVEILENSLIMYSYKEKVSKHLLNMLLTDGIWLAKQLDLSIFS